MADEIHKKIIFSAESKLGPVKEELLELNETLEEQLTKQKLLELQGKRNSEAYIEISSQVRLTKQAIRDTNREYDNAVKAINAASNSIQQNRALVSTLTAEYIKLSQAEGSTSAAAVKMKGDIDSVTKTLKEQEKAIGQTNRNVGNYAHDIGSALSQLTGAIPGLQQFSGVTQTATRIVGFLPSAFSKAGNAITSMVGGPGRTVIQGFGKMEQSAVGVAQGLGKTEAAAEGATESVAKMAPAATEAAAGEAAVGAGAVATGGLLVVLSAIIATAVVWFQSLASVGQKTEQMFGGIKAAMIAFGNDVAKGDFSTLAADLREAYDAGVQLTQGLQELDRQMSLQEVDVAEYDRLIAKNMLLLRNKKTTYAEAVQIDKETKELDKQRVEEKLRNARAEYEIAVESSVNGKKISDKEKGFIINRIREQGVAAAQALEFGNEQLRIKADQVNKGTSEAIKKASLAIIQAETEQDLQDQKSQNRLDIIQSRFGKANAKMADTATRELAQAKANIAEAEQTRLQSLARQAELMMSTYGKELAGTDAHYQELLYKERQFVAQQEKLAKLAKTPAAKSKFLEAAAKGRQAIDQLQNEWDADIQQHYEKSKELMLDLVVRSQDELNEVVISNIKDVEEKQIASVQYQQTVKDHAYEKEKRDRQKQLAELRTDAANAGKERKAELTKQADDLQKTQDDADKKQIAEQQHTADEIIKIKRDSAIASQKAIDEANIIKTGENGSSADIKANFEAQQKILDDDHNANLQKLIDHQITAEEFRKIDEQYIADSNALTKKANAQLKQAKIELASSIANDGLQIVEQSIQRSNQAQQTAMERQKNHDLQNQALTATQRYGIEEKYRAQEGQAKVKEFRQQQAISAAKIIISTAEGVAKDAGSVATMPLIPYVIATGAAELAVVAAQKAPAYATGGVHYTSDGRGGVLSGPGTGKSDSMNARLSNGESIINANSTSMFAPILSAINVAGGGLPFGAMKTNPWLHPGFASGGVFNTYLPVADNGLRTSSIDSVRLHSDDIATIIGGLSDAMKNLPAPVVDVKDINYQNGRLTKVYDRNNH